MPGTGLDTKISKWNKTRFLPSRSLQARERDRCCHDREYSMLCGQHWRGWGRGGFPRKRLSNLNWTCCWWEEQGWRPGGNSVCVKFEALEWFWMIGTGVLDWRGEVSCLFFFGNFYKSPLNLVDYTPPLCLQLNFSYGVCVCVCVCVCLCVCVCVRSHMRACSVVSNSLWLHGL